MYKSFVIVFCLLNTTIFADDNNRIDYIEKSLKKIEEIVFDNNFKSPEKEVSAKIAQMSIELNLLREDMYKLNNSYNQLKNDIIALKNEMNDKINNISNNLVKVDSMNDLIKETPNIAANNIHFDNKTPEELYQHAYSLIQTDKFHDAIEAFQAFIKNYPNNPLIGNAYYWVGELYYKNKDYKNAALEYLNGYNANPKTGRAIDNLIGLADSMFMLNNNKQSCLTINKIRNEFASISNANQRKIDELIKNTGCQTE